MDHQLISDKLSVNIRSTGAEVTSVKNRQGLEFMWQAEHLWPRHAPVLFPIVGRLRNNSYTLNGRSYELSQHGFARDQEFSLVSGAPDTCTWELRPNEKTRAVYPFDFVLKIIYTLKGETLECTYAVQNPSDVTLHFSVGAHPAFRCPLLEGESFSDYYIEFEQRNYMVTALQDGLRTSETRMLPLQGKKLSLTSTLFDQDALVFENGQVEWVKLASSKNQHTVTMTCKGWPYFGIWSKKGGDRFVCLEPWQGIADHVSAGGRMDQKTGIISLHPGAGHSCSYTTTFV